MRTVILPSMLDILSRNYAFKNKGVKLYEIRLATAAEVLGLGLRSAKPSFMPIMAK